MVGYGYGYGFRSPPCFWCSVIFDLYFVIVFLEGNGAEETHHGCIVVQERGVFLRLRRRI